MAITPVELPKYVDVLVRVAESDVFQELPEAQKDLCDLIDKLEAQISPTSEIGAVDEGGKVAATPTSEVNGLIHGQRDDEGTGHPPTAARQQPAGGALDLVDFLRSDIEHLLVTLAELRAKLEAQQKQICWRCLKQSTPYDNASVTFTGGKTYIVP